jgi:large subunit ribosomal protein L30
MAGKLKVTQTKSTISHIARNRATVKALGLHGIGSTSVVADNPATRGMVRQVRFLVTVEEVADTATERAAKPAKGRSEDRGDASASRRSEDSEDPKEKAEA